MKRLRELPAAIALGLIETYQRRISPFTPASCRFRPTCSEYAREAIKSYGLLVGGWLAFKRLLRCHPLHPCAYDPVPRDIANHSISRITSEGEQNCSR